MISASHADGPGSSPGSTISRAWQLAAVLFCRYRRLVVRFLLRNCFAPVLTNYSLFNTRAAVRAAAEVSAALVVNHQWMVLAAKHAEMLYDDDDVCMIGRAGL